MVAVVVNRGLPYTDRRGSRRFQDKEGDMPVERVLKAYCGQKQLPWWGPG